MHKGTVFYKSDITGGYEKLFDYNFVDKITTDRMSDKCVQKWEFIIYSPNKYIETPKGNFAAKCWCDTCGEVLFETTCAKLGLITYMDGGGIGRLPRKAKVELSVDCQKKPKYTNNKAIFDMKLQNFCRLLEDDNFPEATHGTKFSSLVVVPTLEPHNYCSGLNVMKFVLADENNIPIAKCTRNHDILSILGTATECRNQWHIDCLPCGLIRIFGVNNFSKVILNTTALRIEQTKESRDLSF